MKSRCDEKKRRKVRNKSRLDIVLRIFALESSLTSFLLTCAEESSGHTVEQDIILHLVEKVEDMAGSRF